MKAKSILLLLLVFPLYLGAQMYDYDYDDEDGSNDSPASRIEIITVDDLEALGEQARREKKIIFLEMSASYCGYCRHLEDAIIKPMILSGDYEDYVLIRKMEIDSRYPMKNFNGSMTSPADYAYEVNASLTPTLLFLDHRGEEVSERIIGVNTLEMYGGYVDVALDEGHRKIYR